MAQNNGLALTSSQHSLRYSPYHSINLVKQPPSEERIGQTYTAEMDKNDIKAIENARQRYAQLTHTLNSFQNTLLHSEQLPPWPNQQSQFAVLSSNLESISKSLSQHFPTVPPPSQSPPQGNAGPYRPPTAPSASQPNLQQDTLIAYPNPLFPSRDNETLIGMLFRKKPQPYVSDWMDAGRTAARPEFPNTNGAPATPWLSDADTYTLWNSAADILRELSEQRDWEDAYTAEEREAGIETVDVGLRPEMMEIGTVDEKGKKKVSVGGAPAGPGAEGGLKLEQFFRFWSTGMMPHVPGQAQGIGR